MLRGRSYQLSKDCLASDRRKLRYFSGGTRGRRLSYGRRDTDSSGRTESWLFFTAAMLLFLIGLGVWQETRSPAGAANPAPIAAPLAAPAATR